MSTHTSEPTKRQYHNIVWVHNGEIIHTFPEAYQEAISKYSLGPQWSKIIHTYLVHHGAISERVQGTE